VAWARRQNTSARARRRNTRRGAPERAHWRKDIPMIELYYWTTPNGHKITMFLEEAGLEYQIHPVNIGKGEQFSPDFLAISPNNRIPAIVDTEPRDGPNGKRDGRREPLSVFESGAILLYLADKTGKLMPKDLRGRTKVTEWVVWQVANLGPMAGQNHHFGLYAPEKLTYAIDRYVRETNRLYGVLDEQLGRHAWIAGGDYTIADIASYPWVVPWKRQQQNLDDFPNLQRWFEAVRHRPATIRAYELAANYGTTQIASEESRRILFGQTAAVVRKK